jgi:hypothetical protein
MTARALERGDYFNWKGQRYRYEGLVEHLTRDHRIVDLAEIATGARNAARCSRSR